MTEQIIQGQTDGLLRLRGESRYMGFSGPSGAPARVFNSDHYSMSGGGLPNNRTGVCLAPSPGMCYPQAATVRRAWVRAAERPALPGTTGHDPRDLVRVDTGNLPGNDVACAQHLAPLP
jgi:hypothetical protein